MLRSLFTAVTGLDAQKTSMDVIGHNLANVSTVGYKKERVFFQDIFYQNLAAATAPTVTRPGRNPLQVGLGARVASIDTIFSQGALENTGVATDVAIQGKGFFVVKYGNDEYYTRAGNFRFDNRGALVDENGYRVQGYKFNETTGSWELVYGDIVVNPNEQMPPKATDIITLKANLSSGATGYTYETWVVGPFKNSASQTVSATDVDRLLIANSCMANAVTTGDYIEIIGTGHDGQSISGKFYLNNPNITVPQVVGRYSISFTSSITVTASFTVSANAPYVIDVNTGKIYKSGDVVSNGATIKLVGTYDDLRRYLQYLYGPKYMVRWENGILEVIDKTCGKSLMSLRMRFVDNDVTGSSMTLPDIRREVVGKDADKHVVVTTIYDKTGQAHTLKITFMKLQGEDYDDSGDFFDNPNDNAATTKNSWLFYTELDDKLLEVDGSTGRVDFGPDGIPRITYYYAHFNYTTSTGATIDIGAFGNAGVRSGLPLCGSGRCPNNLVADIDGDGKIRILSSGVTFSIATLNDIGAALGIHVENSDFFKGLFDNPIYINVFDNLGNLLLTGQGGDSRTYYVDQNGYPAGDLSSLEIDDNGIVNAYYTNGKVISKYRLVLAGFNNEQGLKRMGGNLFSKTSASGNPFYGTPSEAGLGTLRSGTLEMSNVDIAEEFTKMIIAQRAFQANARVITTSDEMLQEVIALKR
ncbi:MAG: flagellar hook protein FlgE [Thermosulfidibacteraceae bacterium]|jgi:flagellar hook protein FlgE